MKTFAWYCYGLKCKIVMILHYKLLKRPVKWKRWAGKKLLNPSECNKTISDAIRSGEPFMAARFGFTEMGSVLALEKKRVTGENNEQEIQQFRENIHVLSGMFSNDTEGFEKFSNLYLKAAGKCDLFGVWLSENVKEEYLLKTYCYNAKYTKAENLEPYYCENEPWSKALAGKRVLVIHPFADSIEEQYKNRCKLWKNPDILPEFELETIKAVQTLCNSKDERFPTWFDALQYMEEQIATKDFDVAIIGCGAYGLPLAAYVKSIGKQAIHLGGAVQVMFGIRGKRWEDIPFFQEQMNEYWKRPSEDEKPKEASSVEEGCYW